MKKARILSAVLAVIMLISALCISVSAESTDARAQLETAINETEMQIPVGGNYSNESFQALLDSIDEAKAMLEDENATDEEMLWQIDKMNAALNGLVAYDWDTDALWEAIQYAESLNEEDYTEESFKPLEEIMLTARGALYYAQSQEEVDAKTAEITNAVANLVPIDATTPTEATEPSTEATVDEPTEPTEVTDSTEITEPTEITEATEASTEASFDEPIETSASTTAPEATIYILGDADENAKVNIKDATAIQKQLAKLVTLSDLGLLASDATEDGKVNIKDATEIQKHLANLPANENIGKELEVYAAPTETTAAPIATEPTETTAAIDATVDQLPTDTAATIDETEATIATVITEATTATEAPSTDDEETLTLYFENTQNWEKVNIHYWSDSESTSWPGVSMIPVETNDEGYGVYMAMVPANITGVVFNAGENMPQTVDILNIENNMCFSPANGGSQHLEVEISEYTPKVDASIDFEVLMDARIGSYGSLNPMFFIVEDESDLVYEDVIAGEVPTLDTSTLQERGKVIVVMLNALSSGSSTQTIDELKVSDGTLVILKTVNSPFEGTADMNYRFVAIEVNKADVENVTGFSSATVFSYE